ncbi:MAG: YtxH domain-containing protein [Ferruginibacter sp.]
MSKKAVMAGLLAGAVAGALAGILLAPDKGSQTRKKLSDKSKEKVDGLKSGFDNFIDSMVNKFSKASDDVQEKYDKSRSAV